MPTDPQQLLNCPVCGCEPRIENPVWCFRWWGIVCPNMDCHVLRATAKTYEDAKRKWNKRSKPTAAPTEGVL